MAITDKDINEEKKKRVSPLGVRQTLGGTNTKRPPGQTPDFDPGEASRPLDPTHTAPNTEGLTPAEIRIRQQELTEQLASGTAGSGRVLTAAEEASRQRMRLQMEETLGTNTGLGARFKEERIAKEQAEAARQAALANVNEPMLPPGRRDKQEEFGIGPFDPTTPGTIPSEGTGTGTIPPVSTVPPVSTSQPGEAFSSIRDQLLSNVSDPQLPESARQTAVPIVGQAGEFADPADPSFQISPRAQVAANGYEAANAALANATTPQEIAAAQAVAAEVTAATKGVVSRLASAGTASGASVQAAIQDLNAVDPKTMADAVTRDLPNEATVKGQLDGLLSGLENGEVPLWAQPAIAQAEAMMASRGLSTSSVGQNAMFNSIISAALPIAQQDSKSKLAVFQQNLSNEQQAELANSKFFQDLTVQNLNNRQQAAVATAANMTSASIANAQNVTQASVSNASNFLQMDVSNLNNEQQAQMASGQFRQQAMLSTQAAENTAKQFNAASEQQADQFNENLAASIDQFNATQTNTAEQFSANAQNAMSQFNSQQGFAREQFNVQNATAIEQSNATWRRQMNQMNTASENAVNQANAMNQFNLSNQALTFLWQEQRDAAKWANDNTQNEEERRTRIAIAALSNESAGDATSLANIKALASVAINIFDNWGN